MNFGALPIASNRATYNQSFQLYDDEEGEGIDLADAVITIEVRRPDCTSAEITATIDNGKISITDEATGTFELTLTTTDMRTLDQLQYEVGITIEQNDETIQYLIGTLPVFDGIVS